MTRKCLLCFTGVLAFTGLLSPVRADGLLAAWQFEAGDVNGASVSATGGSASNTTGSLQADAAIVDGALVLDGEGDFLEFGNDLTELRPPGGTLTIAAWVNTNSAVTALRRVVEHEDNTYFWAEGGIFQYTTHGTPNGAQGRAQSTTAPKVGQWQHVLVTFSAGGPATIYIDGVMEGFSNTPQAPIPNNTQTFQIGARRSGSGAPSNSWDGSIDDVGIWDCELPQVDIDRLAGVGAGGYPGRVPPTGLGADCNGDGIPDGWYEQFGLDPCSATVGGDDPDDDGLTTLEEFGLGTNPTEADTDSDGLEDKDEIDIHHTNPNSADSDGDGIEDGDEINAHSTDPNNPDSDGDGLSDGDELDIYLTDPNQADSDGDGTNDGTEVAAGTDPNDPNVFPRIAVPEGLYLYYSFDSADLEGDTVIDRAGNPAGPFDGTLTNGGPGTVAGFLGEAAEFAGGANNGDNQFVDLASYASTASTLQVGSIAAWVKPDTTGLSSDVLTIMAISNANLGNGEMRYWISNGGAFGTGTLAYQTRGGPQDASIISTGVNLFDGEWHHVVVTVDSARTATLYVDGVSNTTSSIGFLDIPDANSMSVGRNKDSTAGGGQWFYDGLIDDLGVWERPLNAGEIAYIYTEGLAGNSALSQAPTGPGLEVSASGDDLVFTWDSLGGKLYNLRSETDPSSADSLDWPVYEGNQDLAATPPRKALRIPRPAEPFRLFVIEEFNAPPTAVFSENFDVPSGWTAGARTPPDTGTTVWEIGTPSNVGPAAATSPPNCAATNLGGNYGFDTDIYLRTPPIDLSNAGGATLRYSQFVDIEEVFDSGSVRVLDADNLSELAVIQNPVDGAAREWERITKTIPAAALGKTVLIEFRLQSDDVSNFAGWYLDDVEVTVP